MCVSLFPYSNHDLIVFLAFIFYNNIHFLFLLSFISLKCCKKKNIHTIMDMDSNWQTEVVPIHLPVLCHVSTNDSVFVWFCMTWDKLVCVLYIQITCKSTYVGSNVDGCVEKVTFFWVVVNTLMMQVLGWIYWMRDVKIILEY